MTRNRVIGDLVLTPPCPAPGCHQFGQSPPRCRGHSFAPGRDPPPCPRQKTIVIRSFERCGRPSEIPSCFPRMPLSLNLLSSWPAKFCALETFCTLSGRGHVQGEPASPPQ